jgi:hypothetical protein
VNSHPKRRGLKMEPRKFQVFIVKEDSPAFGVIKKYFNQKRSIKSGRIIPVSKEEFNSFKKDFLYLEIDRTKTDNKISARK